MRKKNIRQWVLVVQSLEKSSREINRMLEFGLQKGRGLFDVVQNGKLKSQEG